MPEIMYLIVQEPFGSTVLGKYTALEFSSDQDRGTGVCVSPLGEHTSGTLCGRRALGEPRAALMGHDQFLPLSTPMMRAGRPGGEEQGSVVPEGHSEPGTHGAVVTAEKDQVGSRW